MVDITERLRLNATDWIFGDTAITALKEITTLRQRVAELESLIDLDVFSLAESNDLLRQRVAELEKERDKATQYWNVAEGRCDSLRLTLNTFQQAVEHVTENGNTRRAFSTSEGWAMIHKDRLLDLEIAEEKCDALTKQRDDLLSALYVITKRPVIEAFSIAEAAIASVKEK